MDKAVRTTSADLTTRIRHIAAGKPARLLLLVLLGLAWAIAYAIRHRPPTERDTHAVAPLISAMRTHCIGRYLIDLPQGFAPSDFSEAAFYIGLDADHDQLRLGMIRPGITKDQFTHWTQSVIKQWDRPYPNAFPTDPPSLLAYQRAYGDDFLLHTRFDDRLIKAVSLRYFGLRDGVGFELVHLTDNGPESIALTTSRLLDMARRASGVRDPEKSPPGACYDDLLIAGRYDEEKIDLDYRHPNHPDLRFEIYFSGIDRQDDKDVFQRVGWLARYFGVGVWAAPLIHERRYPFHGMEGTEAGMVTESDLDNGQSVYDFRFETRREHGSLRAPMIRVLMHMGRYDANGKQVGTAFTQGEAKAIWQAVIQSLRPRPGALQ
ncbi:T6SS immunity protein Tli4 family protein [Aquincola sp. MAHUQ-54]|uniref:T6SS immunity protein Tli4 family protein n=1 Tax=Aquincola agrisoli TaxID=3119538 RepID=A0AAW9Q2D9_9BURK